METVKTVCSPCSGTGLYQGMCEQAGAFVVCHHCDGTGCVDITYEPFEKRKPQPKCKRVYLSSCGYVITDHDIVTEEGVKMPFSKCGISYEEWKDGKKPQHMRFLGCPMYVDQGSCHKRDGFTSECNKLNEGWLNYIPDCKYQPNKDKCWERFDNDPR